MEFQNYVVPTIKKRLHRSQLLLGISIIIALAVAYMGYEVSIKYYFFAIYFVVIGAFALPNINRCKKDIADFNKNVLGFKEGKVVDVFPEKDEKGKWIIFMDVPGQKRVVEFLLPEKPSVQIDSTVKVFYTSTLQLPVRIEQVC